MAKIDVKKMERENKFRNTVHEEVEASYTVFLWTDINIFKLTLTEKAVENLKVDQVKYYNLTKIPLRN